MAEVTAQPGPEGCGNNCQAATSIDALNRTCYCLSLDEEALRRGLEADLGTRGLSSAMVETHPHLFASVPMFVSREQVERMARVIGAVEAVVATPHFRRAALAWGPDIARFDPGSPGGLLGYDFHLAVTGPQLIEINTNPGGALLNAILGRAHRSCCADAAGFAMAPMEADDIEEALFEVFMTEWRLQRKGAGDRRRGAGAAVSLPRVSPVPAALQPSRYRGDDLRSSRGRPERCAVVAWKPAPRFRLQPADRFRAGAACSDGA
jgi:hypothetical protein